jgi:hypothetical protein
MCPSSIGPFNPEALPLPKSFYEKELGQLQRPTLDGLDQNQDVHSTRANQNPPLQSIWIRAALTVSLARHTAVTS